MFDPNDFGRLLKTSDQDIQVYKITPGGKKFVGYTGLRDPLWARPFDLLCENTLSSVTFYTETYTKPMMPDRIAGNLSDLMIAYSRVYKAFNPEDNDSINFYSFIVWSKRITYSDSITFIGSYYTSDKSKVSLVYPFTFNRDHITEIFSMKNISSMAIKPGYLIVETYSRTYKGTDKDNFSIDFPNIKLKPNLNDDISPTNKDPFNILL